MSPHHSPVDRWEVYLMWAVTLSVEVANLVANLLNAKHTRGLDKDVDRKDDPNSKPGK